MKYVRISVFWEQTVEAPPVRIAGVRTLRSHPLNFDCNWGCNWSNIRTVIAAHLTCTWPVRFSWFSKRYGNWC